MTGLPGEHRTGSSGQTVGDRIVDARGETFVSTGRNFCSDHVRLKYPRFARYGQKMGGDTSRITPVGSTAARCTERTGDRRPSFHRAVLLAGTRATTFPKAGRDLSTSVLAAR